MAQVMKSINIPGGKKKKSAISAPARISLIGCPFVGGVRWQTPILPPRTVAQELKQIRMMTTAKTLKIFFMGFDLMTQR